MSKIGLVWWVDGQKATVGGRNHTIRERHQFDYSANPPAKQIHNFFCYCFITLLVRNSPTDPHLEYFFRANQGSFSQRVVKAVHHPFYRNLLCVRKSIACTQACISKYNSFSFPSPASFAEPSICAVLLQPCKCDRFPPALHCPAPLGAAGSNYQPCLIHNASVNDDSERDLTPFLKPWDAVDLFELVIHNSPHHHVLRCTAAPPLAFSHSAPAPSRATTAPSSALYLIMLVPDRFCCSPR